ncbi:probable prolyl 4-hydroxylase 9 isoform X2 [Durio zibethinus]|uniref:Probable prolyl 4-hydroxylase 9 isoform X2 n=1 Tax=Durio zibethinus TaxID=66656 RepID=A0A6P6AF44_DURZI|nr:probable prolyl 4-hydroxylase 9 isoform X2 [Durio zibethinus]
MKGKSKSSKTKLGLPTALLLCSLSFLAGLFVSNLLSQDVPIIKPRLRRLEMVHEEGKEYRDPMPNGETGESLIESIPFQVLSWKPRAYYFPSFATTEQCEHVIAMAKLNLKPSTLALRKGETAESTKGTRTSSGTFISASDDETGTLDLIEKKIAKATSIPQSHGEAFNILRYEIGQKYDSHYDAFNPSEYGPQSSQRVASFLLYLSDVEEGGETMFPFETSLHGSCPVIKGEKWVATKWIRDREQND